MVDPKLLSYVKKELARGASKDKLRAVLIANKWPEKEVDVALKEAQPKEPEQALKEIIEDVEKEKLQPAKEITEEVEKKEIEAKKPLNSVEDKRHKKGGIPILTIIVLLVVIVGLYFWLRPSCPDCEDNNPCTTDSCSKETNHLCVHTPLNGPQPGCESEVSCGTKTCKDGVCDGNYKNDCCGNKKCETGETYDNCAEDCPDCNDDNTCTKDNYDYHEQKCINEPIIPCCGNGICDKDAETYSNCPTDCPNCNDGNRLTADSFNYATQKCENIVTHYFIDDFEEGTQNWVFSDKAWSTIVEDGNTVLKGPTLGYQVSTKLENKNWTNYIFKVRFKIINGGMHFDYRLNPSYRAHVSYEQTYYSVILDLGKKEEIVEHIQLDKNWHTLEIRCYDNVVNVYIDDKILIKYQYTESLPLSSGVALETMGGTEILIDDVEIKVVTEKDITYP